MSDSSWMDELRGLVNQLVISAPREHFEFFRIGFDMTASAAEEIGLRYVAACVHLRIDPGFGASRGRLAAQPRTFNEEFAKAGLGTVVRSLDGSTNVKLRIANHLQDKRNAREATRSMAPSRRSAIQMEMSKLSSMPPHAFLDTTSGKSGYWGIRG